MRKQRNSSAAPTGCTQDEPGPDPESREAGAVLKQRMAPGRPTASTCASSFTEWRSVARDSLFLARSLGPRPSRSFAINSAVPHGSKKWVRATHSN